MSDNSVLETRCTLTEKRWFSEVLAKNPRVLGCPKVLQRTLGFSRVPHRVLQRYSEEP